MYNLHVAIGDDELVRQILNQEGDILMYVKTSPKGFYPFELSLHHMNIAVADILVQRGFSYNSPMNSKVEWEIRRCFQVETLVSKACVTREAIKAVTLAVKAGW